MKATAYLLQAALVGIWWIGLATSESFFAAFQFDGIGRAAFWSFLAPDVLVIASLSLLRAYKQSRTVELLVLGGFAYAALYCVNATLLTSSGYLSSGLMLLGLCYNAFLCFDTELFRNSQTSSVKVIALKTFVQIVCTWILALVVVPYTLMEAFDSLSAPSFNLAALAGMTLFLPTSLLGLVSAYYMVRYGGGTPLPIDQAVRLVDRGPYRFVRNPMAIAGIGQGLCVALIFESIPVLSYAMLGAVVWHLAVRPIEERNLAERFGEEYLMYRSRVWCWIPKLPKV
ncbi:MAG: isoprenylcysteine carboxylmethyltransferase family protein [Planctomycetales bacterium]|nr:isoprenylcysteine carboxylmethyltransferase family protein [Planctomycetales bacterium]